MSQSQNYLTTEMSELRKMSARGNVFSFNIMLFSAASVVIFLIS